MFANTLILLFIIAMTSWSALAQGFFSAFLQLMAIVLAAVLAVALWEPISFGLIKINFSNYAWGIGLLGPFILWLVILRTITRLIVPSEIEIGKIANGIGGGVCGLLSAVLASGVTVLGIGFLPVPPDVGGYRPLVIQEKWRVAQNPHGQLWLPVDRYAQSFLSMLSNGALSSGNALSKYQPDLIQQAALFHMRYDPNSALVATPTNVQVTRAYGWPMPIKGLHTILVGRRGDYGMGHQLILVDTLWQIDSTTLDADGLLRVPPTQIRLVTERTDAKRRTSHLHAPVGWVQIDTDGQDRVYTSLDSSAKPIFQPQSTQPQLLGWVFIVPIDARTRFILIRRLRHQLPQLDSDPRAPRSALGQPQNDDNPIEPLTNH